MYSTNNFSVSSTNKTLDLIRLTCSTINVGGLANDLTRAAQFASLKEKRLSIIYLQETHGTVNRHAQWNKELPRYLGHWAEATLAARGCGILIEPNNFKHRKRY